MNALKRVVFIMLLISCATPWVSPPLALVLGILSAFLLEHAFPQQSATMTKRLLQGSVIGLGFGMNLNQVLQAGASGIIITLLTIIAVLAVGWLIGNWLKLDAKLSYLICAGTAICGGSAIAAVAPVLNANQRDISVSLGTVFILNSVALLLFPWIGQAMHLSQDQFGLWAAIAIHDTSSVVGAAAKYGTTALQIATTVKLARALWIVPLTLATALLFRNDQYKISLPVFILFFLVASLLSTYVPVVHAASPVLVEVAKAGLRVTLFLIGAGLSMEALRAVGLKPLAQGVLLWVLTSVVSLWAILTFS